ncbi:hypothetical protein FBEOM_1603 [Fusarium beomiforme]|uniref:Uncharacterized protein n=1 Tax=Fusarium beomiforme TaxID=44412 RepID=A0A9P5AT16_9HYPO|nr:hypothetical protein FBEOM_1603 [Fusarium beomiforme]
MCLYGRVVFECAHERWGICVKQCQTAEEFRAKMLDHDCVMKKPHVPTSRRVQQDCNKCIKLNGKLDKAKKCIGNLRQTMKRVEERTTAERKVEERKIQERKIEGRHSKETRSIKCETGLGSITEESEDADESESDETSRSSSQAS